MLTFHETSCLYFSTMQPLQVANHCRKFVRNVMSRAAYISVMCYLHVVIHRCHSNRSLVLQNPASGLRKSLVSDANVFLYGSYGSQGTGVTTKTSRISMIEKIQIMVE